MDSESPRYTYENIALFETAKATEVQVQCSSRQNGDQLPGKRRYLPAEAIDDDPLDSKRLLS